jgi:hypothetical protein
VIDAYRGIGGGARDFAHAMDGTWFGDPTKATVAVEAAPRTPVSVPSS